MAVEVVLRYRIMHKGEFPIEVELAVTYYPQYESHPRQSSGAIAFESSLPVNSTIEYLGMQMGSRYIPNTELRRAV